MEFTVNSICALFGISEPILVPKCLARWITPSSDPRPHFTGRLVVGICLGIFYKAYKVRYKKLVAVHGWLAILGSFGLTFGMWMYNLNPFQLDDSLVLVLFIVGGSLLLAFLLFAIITFYGKEQQ